MNAAGQKLWAKHIRTPAGRQMLFLSMIRPIGILATWKGDDLADRPSRARYYLKYLNRIRDHAGPHERFEGEPETVATIDVPSMDELRAQLEAWAGDDRPRPTAWARILNEGP